MLLVVGRIGRAHGVLGEATVEVRTDLPDERFYVGAQLTTDPAKFGPLTIESARGHNGVLLLKFTTIKDRTAIEKLRDVLLLAEVDVEAEFVDEAQSLERGVLLTVLSRMGQNSRVVLTHDVAQRDNIRVGRHDGVVAVVESLKGHPLFAHVTLMRSERSAIAALVTEMLEEPLNFSGWYPDSAAEKSSARQKG